MKTSLSPISISQIMGGDLKESRRERDDKRWEIGIWRSLCTAYGIPRSLLRILSDDRETDPDAVFRENLGNCEAARIYPVRLRSVNLGDLLLRPIDNPAFRALEKLDCSPFTDGGAVVFPVDHNGDWVLHTLGHPSGSLSGKSVIITYANSCEGRDLVAEKLVQFIETRKGSDL